ncbi:MULTISPECIES: amino acid permease [Culturomica]|uniref:amino acid permease n=1 Tax=Culturomica TaxID=1926651 RepID=UPI000336ED2E|nr:MULTISPECIES: amino acid permease [Culturomica]CCZ10073.1 putative glutamate/gamma-aminobutyrate antiporter [Odoribacter sp. CAG:788]HBO27594.1 amino acid permease [Culturomica sp.]
MKKIKNISTTQLALMTAAAIISLRGLPMMAQEELTMFFYIFFATFLFLIPAALVGAELGSAFADRGGGVYTWVKEAFNRPMGFTAIFLQWIQNVVWYPTVLGFAAAAVAYMIGKPELAQNGVFVGVFAIVMYWFATWITLKGTSVISRITSQGFLLGTVLPGIVIIVMAIIWLAGKNPIAFEHIPDSVNQIVNTAGNHAHPRFFPHMTGMSDIAFLAGILLLFAGVEVHAVHAPELKNPQKQFPAAMFLAALISFGLFTLGALAVAIVTPYNQINLQDGLLVTFTQLFDHYHIGWLTNIISLLIAFGALAGVMSWISGPSRGLLWTAHDGELPEFLKKTNKNGVQIHILLIQGCLVTVLSSLYIVMSNVSVAFFLLSALTIGLYLIMYMLMYASGIKLRYTQPDLQRSYRVPGGNTGMWIIAGIGFLAVLFSFIVTFFPPSQLPVGSPAFYTGLVITGTVIFVGIPIIISLTMEKKRKKQALHGQHT